jgi:N-acetylglutamate synthase-like GNAT family acetyltransferase
MFSFDNIKNEDTELSAFLSHTVKKNLPLSQFEMTFITEPEVIEDADLLVEAIFPSKEAEDYKPSQLLINDQTFGIAILKKGIVIGCLVASLDSNEAILHTLAIDEDYRNNKLGSILLILLHEVCTKLDITSLSLISSPYGELLYDSFKFQKMAHNSYETTLPFNKEIINQKLTAIKDLYFPKTEKKRPAPYPPGLIQNSKRIKTDKDIKAKSFNKK